ncbi:MAG: hypothetical protein A2Z83_03845 [Omnitrophica bacterium GWA2_52_8]|nr:MAG: hypothetical protein A2Z83_03845 [Omnitrophica bacterium GWA2_52_8]
MGYYAADKKAEGFLLFFYTLDLTPVPVPDDQDAETVSNILSGLKSKSDAKQSKAVSFSPAFKDFGHSCSSRMPSVNGWEFLL